MLKEAFSWHVAESCHYPGESSFVKLCAKERP